LSHVLKHARHTTQALIEVMSLLQWILNSLKILAMAIDIIKSYQPSKPSHIPSHVPSRPSPLRTHNLPGTQQHVSKLAGAQPKGRRSVTPQSVSASSMIFKTGFQPTSLGSLVGTASSLIALDVEAWRIGTSMLPASPTF
jgi:hypothetical protein